jgi:ComF family protein
LIEKAFERIEFNLPRNMVITYVPMWNKKEKMRGFNQAELIAKALSKRTGRPVIKLIEKIKDGPAQSEVGLEKRIYNVNGTFSSLVSKSRDFSSVLLVDDFTCSGATLNECSEVLESSGINNIYFFTIAKDFRR